MSISLPRTYFEDRYQGEKIVGKWGTAAHVFNNEEQENHHFVLAVSFPGSPIRNAL